MEKIEQNEPGLMVKLEELFREISDKQSTPPRRGAHPACTGLLKAEFSVEPNLPDELKVGLFKQAVTYHALIRTSNAQAKSVNNKIKDLRGFAIKLLDVPGEKCTADPRFQNTQDFILLSTERSALKTARDFFNFSYNFLRLPLLLFLIKGLFNGMAAQSIRITRKQQYDTSPLDIRYWSLTPYSFGERGAKFSIIPTSAYKSTLPAEISERYLTDNMASHLANHEATFDFMVQFFQDQEKTPIENIGVEWTEADAPFIKIATLRIPKQNILTQTRFDLAEDLSYSPGHALIEHRPLGGINRARVFVYDKLWRYRMAARKKEGYEADSGLFEALA
jgi:hypothetical protein